MINLSIQHAHSLGTCIISVAAKFLRVWGIVVETMLAIDPVSYDYDITNPLISVSKRDVDYLQVIHISKLGIVLPVGHSDIYFKGGHMGDQDFCRIFVSFFVPIQIGKWNI